MPELQAAGDVFKLGANGEFDGMWMSSGHLRADAGISYAGRAVFCHGLEAEVGIEAAADIEGALAVFLPSLNLQGRAFASAGAKVQIQLSPNIFEKVGLTVDLSAFAQASVAGRIAVGLDFAAIAALARGAMSDLPYSLFVVFLNEVDIEAGVWGRAAFSAMAEAHLEINGTVMGDDPGIQIAAGAGAGLGGGTAWDFYARVGFKDPRRFYITSVELVVAELVATARRELPRSFEEAIELLEFVAPIAAVTAYDLGEMAAEEIMRPANQSVGPFLKAFSQRLAFYTLDKLMIAGERLLGSLLTEALSSLATSPLDASDRAQLQLKIQVTIDALQDRALDSETAVAVMGPLTDVLELLAPDMVGRWENELAILWSAAVVGRALRSTAASADISLDVLSMGESLGTAALTVPAPPQAVLRAFDRHFAPAPPEITFADAVDFLVERNLQGILEDEVPEIAATLGQLADIVDLTVGDLVAGALHGALGTDLNETELYIKLRDFVKEHIDGAILGELLPAVKASSGSNPDVVRYVDEVLHPILLTSSSFVFDQVDEMVAGMSHSQFDLFNKTFKSGLGDIVWMVFVRNVVFLSDVLLDNAVDALHGGFLQLETEVSGDAGHAMVDGAVELASSTFGAFSPIRESHAEAVRMLVADLAGAGAAAFGPSTWTTARRDQMRTLTRRLLERDDATDYGDPSQAALEFEQWADCYYIPDVDGLVELVQLMSEMTADEFNIMVELVVPAFETFFLALTIEAIEDMERVALEFIGWSADLAREAWLALQEAIFFVEEALADLATAGEAVDDYLDEIADVMRSGAWRAAVLNSLLVNGMDQAETVARAAPGFDLLPQAAKDAAVGTARGSFDFGFRVAMPALDLGLSFGSFAFDDLGDVIEDAASVPSAAAALSAEIVTAVTTGLNDALGNLGLGLPSPLSIDDVAQAAADFVTGLAGVAPLLQDCLVARQAQLDADADLRRRRDERAAAQADWNAQREQQESMIGGPIGIELLSPAPLKVGSDKNWVYPNEIPIYVRIAGARLSYVQSSSAVRVFAALNGQQLVIDPQAWSFDDDKDELVLRTTASSGLVAGINTLEISVADGAEEVAREAVSFLVNPNVEPRGANLIIAEDLSQFDAPGNDHLATNEEYVTLRNAGGKRLSLKGFKLSDRARHIYEFKDLDLDPNQFITVHTGHGSDAHDHVYWGRNQAVWNNAGDTVYVFDTDRVLWAELVY